MKVSKLIKKIQNRYRKPPCLFHFTDTRNIPEIVRHGLLSRDERLRLGVTPIVTGGNDWSHDQDVRNQLTDFVHLCFFNTHPMEFIARRDERFADTFFIKVLPEVLDRDGVKFCAGVSNAADAEIFDVNDFEEHMDMDALFKRLDWRDAEQLARVKATEKYEILIPKRIPKKFLRK